MGSSYRQKSSCKEKLPWALCSRQRLSHNVDCIQKISSGEFWVFVLQNLFLKWEKMVQKYLVLLKDFILFCKEGLRRGGAVDFL
jgi:hypothetical protein